MEPTPSRAAVLGTVDRYDHHCFIWDDVEFRVSKELCEELAEDGSWLFDELIRGYLGAMPQVAAAIEKEFGDWFGPLELGETPERIAACLGPVTVHSVSTRWGTRLTYTEHRIDEDHLLDLEVTGVWESIDEVTLDG